MCGIAAYYNQEGISVPELRNALAGLDAMRHRGPDGEGAVLINSRTGAARTLRLPESPEDLDYDLIPQEYEDKSADLVLLHRRLSIFDLSSQGHQPMRDEKGNWLILNGEIYNFLEIRDELKQKGHAFKTGTDTEVILAAYREWGESCLQKFRGMWAIILYDAENHRLLVTNDRFGIKALYVSQEGKRIAYASEVKAFLHFRMGIGEFHQQNLKDYLQFGSIDYDHSTLFAHIHRVSPSTFHFFDLVEGSRKTSIPYWESPPVEPIKISEKQAIEQFQALFDEALQLRLRTDVPWGITLSGGLDSSAIVYEVARILKERGDSTPIQTFSAIFPGTGADESKFVKVIEKDLGLRAHYSEPLKEFNFDDFETFLYHQDFPVGSTSSYARWCVFRLVARSDVKVILNGQGGDELLGGYRHHFHRYAGELIRRGKILGSVRETKAAGKMKGRKFWPLYKEVLSMEIAGRVRDKRVKGKTLRERLELDLTSRMMPYMLRYEDRISMAFGIESRVPFLDHKLVEFALQLPSELKIKDGWQKYILRKSMKNVPESISFRKDKKGFTTPQTEWVNAHRERFLDYLDFLEKADIEFDRKKLESNKDFGVRYSQEFRHLTVGAWIKAFQPPA